MTTLHELLPHLAPVIAEHSPVRAAVAARHVTDVVIFDGIDTAEVSPGDLVLGVALTDAEQIADAVAALACRSPAALVVRNIPAACLLHAGTDDLPVIVVHAGTAWMRLVRLLRELLTGTTPLAGSGPTGPDDLFVVANTIAAIVRAPVTIEDPNWQVLAFSESQEGADAARTATILSRRGPDDYVRRMREHGIFRLIHSATRPVFVPGRKPDILPRVVAPVRAGGEFLGSVWAVVTGPLPPERENALAEAARLLAPNLLRHRVVVDARRSMEIEIVARLLDGGQGTEEIVRRNRLTGAAYTLIALRPTATDDAIDEEFHLRRLWDLTRSQLASAGRRSAVARVFDTLYVVLPLTQPAPNGRLPEGLRQWIEHAADEMSRALRRDLQVAISDPVRELTAVPGARHDADRMLDVLARQGVGTRVGTLAAVGSEVLLDYVSDTCAAHTAVGNAALRRLQEFDAEHGTQLVATVEAWLASFGNTERTAAVLHVHPNTVRYRIRQLHQLELIRLDDPVERLALTLHLRLLRRQDDHTGISGSSSTPARRQSVPAPVGHGEPSLPAGPIRGTR